MNENNDKGYGCFVMLVSAVSIIFSIIALLKHDDRDCEISSSGFVIATLSALITFVVAWQIWQTITSKEEIHKVLNIKEDYDKQIKILKEQDARNLCLIEAFQFRSEVYDAEKKKHLVNRYKCALQAIKQFLKSNVPNNYSPFISMVVDLQFFLEDISKANWHIKKLFNERSDEFEMLYSDIIAEINCRISEMYEIKQKIIDAHNLRLQIISK